MQPSPQLVKKNKAKMGVQIQDSHGSCGCGSGCLGPLTFHSEAKGQLVTLSEDGRRATRDTSSFRHGLIFSSRPLRIKEKVCVRIERSVRAWHGALRVGLTSVAPGSRAIPSLAIPELTNSPGYWAIPVPEQQCLPRSELIFWVSQCGTLHVKTDDGQKHSLETSVDTHKPIWAMIDVYGQTNAVLLLGSAKKCLFSTRRSCPAPTVEPTEDNCGYSEIPMKILERMMGQKSLREPGNQENLSLPCSQSNSQNTSNESMEECVVCYSGIANVMLICGHRCVCSQCALRVVSEFGTCPLCRHCLNPAHCYGCT
ncbi:protein neuralized-like [Colossoma macropomum]|uniref:protein neuralized-like n=1 Tax=Colossoma macropomum TaxID=42526 RepID=UPI0018653B31|nr:protein neuralized-like [Colossoma macropomum]